MKTAKTTLKKRRLRNHVMEVPVEVTNHGKLYTLLFRINLIRPLCDIMFGERHSTVHRLSSGTVIAILGVSIAKCFGESHFLLVQYAGDGVGYALHALGVTPYIEWVAKKFREA